MQLAWDSLNASRREANSERRAGRLRQGPVRGANKVVSSKQLLPGPRRDHGAAVEERAQGGGILQENGAGRGNGSPPGRGWRRASLVTEGGIPVLSLPASPSSAARLSLQVHSVVVTHTFRIAKARAQLGYAPDKFSFADAVELYVQSTSRRPRGSPARTLLRWLLGLLLLLGLLALLLRFLDLQPLQATEERL